MHVPAATSGNDASTVRLDEITYEWRYPPATVRCSTPVTLLLFTVRAVLQFFGVLLLANRLRLVGNPLPNSYTPNTCKRAIDLPSNV